MNDEIKALLKQSLLRIPSEHFADRTMQKIHEEAQGTPQPDKGITWSWLFMGVAALVLPVALISLFSFLSIYDSYMQRYFQQFSGNTLLQLSVTTALTLFLLLQLDNLLRMAFGNRY